MMEGMTKNQKKHQRRRDKKAAANSLTQGSDNVNANVAEKTISAQPPAAACLGERGVKRDASEDREVENGAKVERVPIEKARFGTEAGRWIIEHATKWTQLPGGDRPWETIHSVEISTECWPQRGKLTAKLRNYNEEVFKVGTMGNRTLVCVWVQRGWTDHDWLVTLVGSKAGVEEVIGLLCDDFPITVTESQQLRQGDSAAKWMERQVQKVGGDAKVREIKEKRKAAYEKKSKETLQKK